MKFWMRGILAFVLLLATARVGVADCASDDPDGSKVRSARATADQSCTAAGDGCADAPNHGAYVSCIGRAIPPLVNNGSLPKSCVGTLRRCAARSTCGRRAQGFVTCCITTNKGEKLCKVERNAGVCAGRGGARPAS